MTASDCCILNGARGAWAFEPLALQLAAAIGIEISTEPRRFNYVLNMEPLEPARIEASFIPLPSIELAADKRLLAQCFAAHHVPRPRTVLLETFAEVQDFLAQESKIEWCLKFPTGCGANGHRRLHPGDPEPAKWPRPFIVQEFIRMESPAVYRLYAAGGELFGWIVRRYAGGAGSPWVAHARGAQYATLGEAPPEAVEVARQALTATGLLDSFGCVDLLPAPDGRWLALEVGTDGLYNHVDREIDDPALLTEIHTRIARAFWRSAEQQCP